MRFLKQSTAVINKMGPFIDEGDFITPEVALTIAQADIQISKNGGAYAQTSDAAPMTAHDVDGWYPIPLTATDTATLGTIMVQLTVAGSLPVWGEFHVLAANVYDALIGGGDTLDVQVTGIGTDVIDAAAVKADAVTKIQDGLATLAVCSEIRLAELDPANLPADIAAIPTTAMRGTDGANTTTPPTTAAITAAILAGLVDGTLTVAESLAQSKAFGSGKMVKVSESPDVFDYYDDAGAVALFRVTFPALGVLPSDLRNIS